MPYDMNNVPRPAKNWGSEEQRKCVGAANAVLDRGGSDQEAIFACIHAAGKTKKAAENIGFTSSVEIAKVDEDEHLVFGWASIIEENAKPVVDDQGDIILPGELEKAAYHYVLNARVAGDVHKENTQVGRLVESMVFTKAKQQALGIDLGKTGWWVGFHIHDDNVWNLVKSGDYGSFSIGGRAVRTPVE